MALDTIAKLRTQMAQAHVIEDRLWHAKANTSHATGDFISSWLYLPQAGSWAAGVAPTTGSGDQESRSTTGAYPLPAPVSGKSRYLLHATAFVAGGSNSDVAIVIADRLVATSGISAIAAGAQAVNTVALPRYTDGIGVCVGLETYTSITTAAAGGTFSYTNTGGVAGRIGTFDTLRSAGNQFACSTLADGDTGVLSVQSVTIATAGSAAGNFGITIYKPIVILSAPLTSATDNRLMRQTIFDWQYLGLPKIEDDACLFALVSDTTGIGSNDFMLNLLFGYS